MGAVEVEGAKEIANSALENLHVQALPQHDRKVTSSGPHGGNQYVRICYAFISGGSILHPIITWSWNKTLHSKI